MINDNIITGHVANRIEAAKDLKEARDLIWSHKDSTLLSRQQKERLNSTLENLAKLINHIMGNMD